MRSIFTLILLSFHVVVFAGSNDPLWHLSSEQQLPIPGQRTIVPFVYQLAKLDLSAFAIVQASIPPEGEGKSVLISLPTPSGAQMDFRIFEKSMMEPELALRYPGIKTYTAISTQNPLITAKVDFTVFGLHAMVFDGRNTFFIDPYTNLSNEWYIVYYKRDFRKPVNQSMHCLVDENQEVLSYKNAVRIEQDGLPLMYFKTNADSIRNYRLALACTEEYSAAVGGATPTKASVLSAMVTSINRINGVFEREFSMHANLVAKNDTLIFLPGSGDPYTNGSGSTMLGQNQTTINARIGSGGYDFGHVFSTGGGGIASLGCVCNNTNKAQGVTGSSNPVGDPFDIDYVAHEMGHQFGGSHTFNSIDGSCSGNRSSQSAYEIGSGTTIMSYAGICDADDIQPHSDDYYHVRSLEQMTGTNVKACAAIVMSGNSAPQLSSINKNYIIPFRTPFELTASATDANSDPITYCWEQYNRGGSGNAWNAKTTVAPTLRSFYPSTSGTRVFPAYEELIKNTEVYLGEVLPDTNRILKFRCTARDMHTGYGGFYTSTDTTKLDVRMTSGLFRVTSQATPGQTWTGFSTQTITWDVAGTDAAPVAATNVDIYLSIDSGRTWPHTLKLNTPNDGSEVIGVPNVDAKWSRIKVKGSGNVFFDLNDNWIEIKKVVSPAGISDINTPLFDIYPNPSNGTFVVQTIGDTKKGMLEIYSLLGTRIDTKPIKSGTPVHFDHVAKGIYLIKLIDHDQRTSVRKVVIE